MEFTITFIARKTEMCDTPHVVAIENNNGVDQLLEVFKQYGLNSCPTSFQKTICNIDLGPNIIQIPKYELVVNEASVVYNIPNFKLKSNISIIVPHKWLNKYFKLEYIAVNSDGFPVKSPGKDNDWRIYTRSKFNDDQILEDWKLAGYPKVWDPVYHKRGE